ncbi:MAG: ABC transporter permease [Actinomycetota bacterium]
MSVYTAKLAKPFHRIPELSLLLVLFIAIAFFSYFNSYFLSVGSFKVILVTILYTGVILIGEALLMIVGEIDLSVGAVASLGSVTTGLFMAKWGFPIVLSLILGVAVGACVGFVNGFVTVKIGIPAFITTLSMLFLARGLSYVFSGGDPVYPLPEGAGTLSRTEIWGLPSSVWIFLVLFLIADLLLRHTVVGRKLYLIGGNQVAARLSGVKVKKIKILLFVLTGALSSFAGILLMSKLQRSDAITGLGWELNVIAAAAVGGILMTGGGGTLTGAFIGLVFLQVVLQGLTMLGFDAMLLDAISGSIMIAAVWVATRRRT